MLSFVFLILLFFTALFLILLVLVQRGKGGGLAMEGITTHNGRIPVNPSGGVLSTHPYVTRGLLRVAEASLQVMGCADGRQVPEVETALAHSVHGLGGQAHTVVILGR